MNDKNTQVDWLPLPEGSKLEIATRSDPEPLVGITLNFGGGRLTFAHTPAEARAIAAAIVEAADRLDRERSS